MVRILTEQGQKDSFEDSRQKGKVASSTATITGITQEKQLIKKRSVARLRHHQAEHDLGTIVSND